MPPACTARIICLQGRRNQSIFLDILCGSGRRPVIPDGLGSGGLGGGHPPIGRVEPLAVDCLDLIGAENNVLDVGLPPLVFDPVNDAVVSRAPDPLRMAGDELLQALASIGGAEVLIDSLDAPSQPFQFLPGTKKAGIKERLGIRLRFDRQVQRVLDAQVHLEHMRVVAVDDALLPEHRVVFHAIGEPLGKVLVRSEEEPHLCVGGLGVPPLHSGVERLEGHPLAVYAAHDLLGDDPGVLLVEPLHGIDPSIEALVHVLVARIGLAHMVEG